MLQLNGHDENMTPLPVEGVHEQAGELSVLGQANLNESGNTDGDQGVLSGSKLHLLDLPAEILEGDCRAGKCVFSRRIWYGALNKYIFIGKLCKWPAVFGSDLLHSACGGYSCHIFPVQDYMARGFSIF